MMASPEHPAPPPPPLVDTHTRAIGIIHPPPNIRGVIEKTAAFVAAHGADFEARLAKDSKGETTFKFLLPSDPYHAYYQHRVSDCLTKPQSPQRQPPVDPVPDPAPDPQTQFRARPPPLKALEPPELEQYTVPIPDGVTGEELEIFKLTAQFVARNGKSFLTPLIEREHNNLQFCFLKPYNSLFTLFTTLVDVYSKVLAPPAGVIEKPRKGVMGRTMLLERCVNRLEWEQSQEEARQKAEKDIEKERMHMAMIDWHDFAVVETTDFADGEDDELPVPMTLEDVIRQNKLRGTGDNLVEISEPEKDMEMEMDVDTMQLVEKGMKASSLEEILQNKKEVLEQESLRIVRNWKRLEERVSERDPTKSMVSPITGKLIPISEMAEHMRISLIDPKYKEQKQRMKAKLRRTTLAPDDEISRNILGLVQTRPDIFGTTEDEVSNAVKVEMEKTEEVVGDGHNGKGLVGQALPPIHNSLPVRPLPLSPSNVSYSYSVPMTGGIPVLQPQKPIIAPVPSQQIRPTPPSMPEHHMIMYRPAPMPQPHSHIPPPPGFNTVMGVPGHSMMQFPNMSMVPPPPLTQEIPPPPPPEEAPLLPDEPEPKRQKIDNSSLVPEDQFLAQHLGAVGISVVVPNMGEGNLKGQLLKITIQSLSENISSLKEKIAGEIQLPANKQKLSGRAGFLKDNLSLAYYNFCPGEIISLALRERGGRKR